MLLPFPVHALGQATAILAVHAVRLGRALDPKPSIFAHFGHVWLPPFSATSCFRPRSSSFSFCLMSLPSYDNTPCLLMSFFLLSPSSWPGASLLRGCRLQTPTRGRARLSLHRPAPCRSFTTSFILSSPSSDVSLAFF